MVAGVAGYASYVHSRNFARQGGADPVSAGLWPLSVDGLLLLSTVGLLKVSVHSDRRSRFVGWPPVALLLSVELLAHRPVGQQEGGRHAEEGDGVVRDGGDPLLERARWLDVRHREVHQRPVSAESLRKELRIGAGRARILVASVRASRDGGGGAMSHSAALPP